MLSLDEIVSAASTDAEVWTIFKELIGNREIALVFAKAFAQGSTAKVSAKAVARIFEISESAAYDKIKNTGVG